MSAKAAKFKFKTLWSKQIRSSKPKHMSQLSQISLEALSQALRTVQDPDLKKDLVTLGMIKDLKVGSDGAVSLRVVLTTPASQFKEKIKSDVETAVRSVSGVRSVQVTMDTEAKKKAASGPAQSMSIPGVTHIVAVSSGKGGVGKSTVAVNLATALAREGAKVGLLDADVYGPNVPTMMGVTDQPKMVQDPERGELFVPPTAHGVKVMSMGFLIPGDQPAVWRGPMLHSVVNQFLHKVEWGTLDYLIVDMPPGTGDVQLSLAQLVPVSGAVLVSTPQEVSMQDVRKAFNMFEKVRVPILGFVENMSYFICDGCDKKHYLFGSEGGKMLSKKFGVELLAQLPMVPKVREGGDEGRPVTASSSSASGSDIANQFRELARKIVQKVSIAAENTATDPSQSIQVGKFS
jgi:ATP-binding protein involved in chromosome partitioning